MARRAIRRFWRRAWAYVRQHPLRTFFCVIATGALAALLGDYITGWSKDLSDRSSNPLQVEAINIQRDIDRQGATWVFKEPKLFSQDELAEQNELRVKESDWFRSRGGVDPGVTIISLDVRDGLHRKVRIVGMRAIPAADESEMCSDPLTGTLMWAPPGGADIGDVVRVGFKLDSADPNARTERHQVGWSLFR